MSAVKPLMLVLTMILFQGLAAPLYLLGGVAPHFVLLAVLFVALHASPRVTLLVAAVAGLLTDALSLDPWGANTVAFLSAAYFLQGAAAGGWSERVTPRLLILAGALFLAFTTRYVLLAVLVGSFSPAGRELKLAFYTWVLSLPFVTVFGDLCPLIGDEKR